MEFDFFFFLPRLVCRWPHKIEHFFFFKESFSLWFCVDILKPPLSLCSGLVRSQVIVSDLVT